MRRQLGQPMCLLLPRARRLELEVTSERMHFERVEGRFDSLHFGRAKGPHFERVEGPRFDSLHFGRAKGPRFDSLGCSPLNADGAPGDRPPEPSRAESPCSGG